MEKPQETRVRSLVQEDPLEKGMATHSSILAWRIPWTEETGRLQSMRSQKSRTQLTKQQQTRLEAPGEQRPRESHSLFYSEHLVQYLTHKYLKNG